MDIEQKAAAIKSVYARLKNGESKTSIYNDFKETELRQRIETQLSNSPTQRNRLRFKLWNSLLFVSLLSVLAIRIAYFSHPELEQKTPFLKGIVLVAALTILPLMIFKHQKAGYSVVIVLMVYYGFRIGSKYDLFYSSNGSFVLNAFFGLLLVTTLLAVFLHVKLFPQSGIIGIKRDATGNPVFED